MLGYVVPPRGSALKKGAQIKVNEDTKEMKKRKKNESEREGRGREKEALDAIRTFFGIKRATKRETLAVLVNEGKCFCYPDRVHDSSGTEISFLEVRLHRPNNRT